MELCIVCKPALDFYKLDYRMVQEDAVFGGGRSALDQDEGCVEEMRGVAQLCVLNGLGQ